MIRAILDEELGEPGFTSIRRRLVNSIDSPQLRQIFEILGRGIHSPVEVHIAGLYVLGKRSLAPVFVAHGIYNVLGEPYLLMMMIAAMPH